MKSNGLATIATAFTGISGNAATETSEKSPPMHQPTSCASSPPRSSETFCTAGGITSRTQWSRPSLLWAL